MSEDELQHYGVKGMKWGQHKAEVPEAKGYSKADRQLDHVKLGKGSVRRINKRMALKGQDLETARKNEKKFKRNRRLAIVGAYLVLNNAPMIFGAAQNGLNGAAVKYVSKKTAASGAKAAATMFSDARGIGATKVVNLAFNAATGMFE